MTTKHYNEQTFNYNGSNGFNVNFTAYTTRTRNGFCHTAVTYWWDGKNYGMPTDTKTSYLNRTWERFDYETTLKRAIKKLPAEERAAVHAAIIEAKAQEIERNVERAFCMFKAMRDLLLA